MVWPRDQIFTPSERCDGRRSRASVIMINGVFIYPTSLNSYGNIGPTTAQKVTKHKS